MKKLLPRLLPESRDPGGCSLYVGVPGTGKTTLAIANARAEAKSTGRGLIAIDSEGTIPESFGIRLVERPVDAVRSAWGTRGEVRVIPVDDSDVEAICRAALKGKNVVILIDEIGLWASSASTPVSLKRLIRVQRHVGVSLHMTTQYPADVAPIVRQCASRLFAFRSTQDRAVKLLEADFQIDGDRVRRLKVGEHLDWSRGT